MTLLTQAQWSAAFVRYGVTSDEQIAIEQSINSGALGSLLDQVDQESGASPVADATAVFSSGIITTSDGTMAACVLPPWAFRMRNAFRCLGAMHPVMIQAGFAALYKAGQASGAGPTW